LICTPLNIRKVNLKFKKNNKIKIKIIIIYIYIYILETTRLQHMCALAKMDVLLFWEKYRPKTPIVSKINAAELLEGFCGLVG